jgi:hypothetical protein
MTSVHGITVAGGTFPATIWGLFMRAAFAANPPGDWTYPTDPVVWQPFRGQYQYFGPPPGEEQKEEKKKTSDDDSTESSPTTTAPPPTTTAPPPATTAPPPTTTSP